ncbi:YncE family protein [Hyphomicrobium sp.]|uniref:YncE family protein n=1 Tax=Hyphomicrobium sp. TaxID=82 RepID=UPI002E3623C9|nr:YncE family protein [Hyphomicrobium sp.]HEX2842543.1 YncE family protein [Hyphomicrobium sp.]
MGLLRKAAAILAACLAITGEANAKDRIYVLSQSAAALTEIDIETASGIVNSIPLAKAAASLAIAPDKQTAYVTHPDLGQVSVVDLDQSRVAGTLSVGGSPFGVAVTSTGNLFIGDWNGAHITVVDPKGASEPKTVEVGRAPAHLLLTPDEKLLFVANREGDSVSAVRLQDLRVVRTIEVGRAPFAMALSPDGKHLYVGNVQSSTVSVIDTEKLKVTDTLKSGAMPYGAAVTPDGSRVLVSNQQSGTLSILRGTGETPASIKVGGYPEGIAIDASGTRAYVANWFSDDVSVLDLLARRELRRIKCPGGPRAIVAIRRKP